MKKDKLCVIIGYDSYLAQNLDKYLKDMQILKYSYLDWRDNIELIKKADYVLNFAISPLTFTEDLFIDDIIDIQIAKELDKTKSLYFFMSSRKVYGKSSELIVLNEESELKPFDFYSRNKCNIECKLKQILGNRLSIVRISNIIGKPEIKNDYKTFMGWITKNYLEKGYLSLNQSKNTVRDFITKDYFQYVLSELIKNNAIGIHNISSNLNISLGEILGAIVGPENVIEEKEVVLTDQFLLSNEKTKKYLKTILSKENLLETAESYRKDLNTFKNIFDEGKKVNE